MIRVELPIPPSVNRAYANNFGRGKGRFLTKAARDWKAEAGWLIKVAKLDRVTGRYQLAILLPEKMRGDVSNRIKIAEDLLVTFGITPDDSRAVSVIAKRSADVPPGKCVIIVEEFRDAAE